MAQVRFFKIEVTLNKLAKHVVNVPEWEVGIVLAQWGDDAIVIEDETSPYVIERKLPEPRDEFERLAQRYGPKHEETPFVASVYGNFGPGVNALRDAIVQSTQKRLQSVEDEVAALNEGLSLEEQVAAANSEAAEAPDAAGSEPVEEMNFTEGGDLTDSFDDLADLTGEATEDAEAVA